MSADESLLQEKFARLLNWERTKRWERILAFALFYSLLGSLLLLPAREMLERWMNPLSSAPLLFLLLAIAAHIARPWGSRETVRAVLRLDKTLRLQERALTAWEILSRREKKAAEELVLEEATAKLQTVDPKALFKRQRSWHLLLAPPLLCLWLLFLWLDVGVRFEGRLSGSPAVPLAQKLKEFADELEKKARTQSLTESLKIARALEEVAEKGLRKEIGEKELRENLGAMIQKTGDVGPEAEGESDLALSTAAREELASLRAEIEKRRRGEVGAVSEKLAALLKSSKEMEKRTPSAESLDREEAERILERAEQAIVAELDRRTLQETQEFLTFLIKGLEDRETGETVEGATRAEPDQTSKKEKAKGKGTLPGDELGRERQGEQTPPLKATAATHLKGLLGEGKSRSLRVKGELRGKESEVAAEEVVTSYRRQAEQALASEEIPEGLKETIKRYFTSLGITEGQRKE